MGISLSSDQILAMAPDSASSSAGKKLAAPRTWQQLGQNDLALWGECQGSALYQVRVDIANYSVKCSCLSRKFPCKHGLGLLLLASGSPTTVPVADPPEWVTSWLAKRESTVAKKVEKAETAAKVSDTQPTPEQEKRIAKRRSTVTKGLESLDQWMNDLIRSGLASVEHESSKFWEFQAKRLVDAQASGIANMMRQMSTIPNTSPDWSAHLLSQLGRVALLTEAYRHIDTLDAPLQEDLRQLIGWTVKEDEVMARGELVADDWLVLGQWVEEDEFRGNLLTQRTWLWGTKTQRSALILQFSVMNAPYKERIVSGVRLVGELRFWPGTAPVRAMIASRHAEAPIMHEIPGAANIEAALHRMAEDIATQPWQRQRLCLVQNVIPRCVANDDRWWIQDSEQNALPLITGTHWRLLALSGGVPIHLVGEWNGVALRPLGMQIDNQYILLGGSRLNG